MEFIETSIFTKQIDELLSPEQQTLLQIALIEDPKCGDVIPRSGGLRKMRWADERRKKGKRSGIRVIYYTLTDEDQLLMLFAYSKDAQGDLTKDQIKALKDVVEEELQ